MRIFIKTRRKTTKLQKLQNIHRNQGFFIKSWGKSYLSVKTLEVFTKQHTNSGFCRKCVNRSDSLFKSVKILRSLQDCQQKSMTFHVNNVKALSLL